MSKKRKKVGDKSGFSRREFLALSGTTAIAVGIGGCTSLIWMKEEEVAAIPVSGGYLLVDTKKCQGCLSCMLACSLVHEGEISLSLSRIQVMQNSFEKWPDDLTIEQCRQCVDPPCMAACQYGALKAEPEFGNVRMVDRDKCVGCGECVEACPYTPSRPVVVEDAEYDGEEKSRKCDLCAEIPFWEEAGGPGGKQACIEVCPVGALSFTTEVPVQEGDAGYKVNLRDETWAALGYPRE
jgi:protein NrfC